MPVITKVLPYSKDPKKKNDSKKGDFLSVHRTEVPQPAFNELLFNKALKAAVKDQHIARFGSEAKSDNQGGFGK